MENIKEISHFHRRGPISINLLTTGKQAGSVSIPVLCSLCPRTSQASINVDLGEYNCSRRTINSRRCPESISRCDGLRSSEDGRTAVRNNARGWAGPRCGLGRRAEGSARRGHPPRDSSSPHLGSESGDSGHVTDTTYPAVSEWQLERPMNGWVSE